MRTRWLAGLAAVLAATLGAVQAEEPPKAEQKKAPAPADGAWEKLATTDLVFRDTRQVLSIGLYHPDCQHVVALLPDAKPPADAKAEPKADPKADAKPAPPKAAPDAKPVDLELPHAGVDKDGKPRPPLTGMLKQGSLWLDLDGNGKPEAREVAQVTPEGEAGPFTWAASYDDGTAGPYVFKLQAAGDAGRFRVVRCCAKQVRFGRHTMTLLDDNGNGCYNDLGRDTVFINDEPACLLSRHAYIGGKLHEMIVQPGGQSVEIRPVAGLQMGRVDLFRAFTVPQKSENLRLHTIIISGRESSFSFGPSHRVRDVPVGAYDLMFGLLERSGEVVWFRNGESTSFNVDAGQEVAPQWGGPIKATCSVENDGLNITVAKPVFKGTGTEVYTPADCRRSACSATLFRIWRESGMMRVEHSEQVRSGKFEVGPDGGWKPLVLTYGRAEEMMLVTLEYKSGILGVLHASSERFKFDPRPRNPPKKQP